MKSKKITIEDLAGMMKRSFDSTDQKMAEGFKKVDERFDKIEHELIKKNSDEIEDLRIRMKVVEDAMGIE